MGTRVCSPLVFVDDEPFVISVVACRRQIARTSGRMSKRLGSNGRARRAAHASRTESSSLSSASGREVDAARRRRRQGVVEPRGKSWSEGRRSEAYGFSFDSGIEEGVSRAKQGGVVRGSDRVHRSADRAVPCVLLDYRRRVRVGQGRGWLDGTATRRETRKKNPRRESTR